MCVWLQRIAVSLYVSPYSSVLPDRALCLPTFCHSL